MLHRTFQRTSLSSGIGKQVKQNWFAWLNIMQYNSSISNSPFQHVVGNELGSFCLLSERYVLLSLLTNLPDGRDHAQLLIVDFEQEDPHRQSYLNIAHGFKLSLPIFHQSVEIRSFTLRSDPPSSWAPQSDLNVPFHIAQDARVFVASIWVHRDTLRHLALLIPLHTLLRHTDLSGPISAKESMLVWEAWGPQGSRMTEIYTRNPSFEIWACNVYGTRFVFPECSDRSNHTYTLQVFDFNQKAFRNAISQGQKVSDVDVLNMVSLECDSSLCITAPSIFTAGDIFLQETRTTLPYRWIAKMMPSLQPTCSAMCSEDSIIVVDSVRRMRALSFMCNSWPFSSRREQEVTVSSHFDLVITLWDRNMYSKL